jgi:hypothetical protein
MSGTGFFHDCLSDFGLILNQSGLDMALHVGLLDVPCRKKGMRQLKIFGKHWRCFSKIKRAPTPEHGHFIREFSTVPTWFCIKVLRIPAEKFTLLVNHNFQWALGRRWNRMAFRDLQKMGVRYLFFEFVPEAALATIGMTAERCMAIPMPIKTLNAKPDSFEFTVGLIGRWTSESKRAVKKILHSKGMERLLIGASNIREAERDWGDCSDQIWFQDTTDFEDFDKAIQSCRIIYFPYAEELYRYRASGLLTDAVRNQVPVLVPDYPMLRHQVETPVKIGYVHRQDETFSHALARMFDETYDFDGYARERSVGALAALFKTLWGEIE